MADVVNGIIGVLDSIPEDAKQTVLDICAVSVPLIFVVIVDLIKEIFFGFFRG